MTAALLDVRPLRTNPAFRRLWLGNALSLLGGQLALVAVLYQVWELTHSATWVGAVGLARAVPMVLLGFVGGSLADAVDRRRLVLATTVGQAVAAALLATQAFLGWESLAVVLALVAAQSSSAALGAPARRTFPVRLLQQDQVAAGIALTHVSFQAAMLAGPAIGGAVIAGFGVEVCYAVDAVTFVAALYGVHRLPALRPTGSVTPPGPRAIWDGWRFVGRDPVLRGALLTDVLATVLAMPVALFPAINDERFGGRPETLGLFLSAIAAGGIVAGILSGRVTETGRPGAVMLAAATVWGLGLTGFGLAHALWPALGCLALAGAADTVSVISRGTIVQLAAPDSHRGRVSAAEHIIGVAGPDVGNFRGGVVAGATSATVAMVSGGLLCALGVAAIAATSVGLRRFRAGSRAADPAGHEAA